MPLNDGLVCQSIMSQYASAKSTTTEQDLFGRYVVTSRAMSFV